MTTTLPVIDERVALVVGAGGGVGRAVTKQLSATGYRVYGSDVVASGDLVQVDACDRVQVSEWMTGVHAETGRIDLLANCQGTWRPLAWNETSDDDFAASIAANLTSVFITTTEALPYLLESGHGRVVTVASMAGEQGAVRPCSAYAAAKAGVIAFSKSLAREVAADGVTVNLVSPGPVATAMLLGAADPAAAAAALPIARLVTPDEVASAVVFLGTVSSAAITGEVLRVNGGALM